MEHLSDIMLRNAKMQKSSQKKYLDIRPRNEGSTEAGDVMLTPARADKMRKKLPEDVSGDIDILRGRLRPTMRMNPQWAERAIGRTRGESNWGPEGFLNRLKGRGIGGGKYVQDFEPSVVIDPETGKPTRVRRFNPEEGETVTDPGMGIYEEGDYSYLKGEGIPPEDLSLMREQWEEDSKKRENDLKDLSERWNRNIADWSSPLMNPSKQNLVENQFFNNARISILGRSGSIEDSMSIRHEGGDQTGKGLLDIVNRRIQVLDDQIERFSAEDSELEPLFGMQEKDFSRLLDRMREMSPSGVEPGWADMMSILQRGEMFDRSPVEGIGVPPSWEKMRGAYEETRPAAREKKSPKKFTGMDLLTREPFERIEAEPAASLGIKDFFRSVDTSQGYRTSSGEGLLRSQSRQRLASIKQERNGLEEIRSSLIDVLKIHEQLMGMKMTAEKMRQSPELLSVVDDAMVRMLNSVAITYKDPERFVARGTPSEEGGTAPGDRLNLSYNVDEASNMLILTKVLYLAKAWDAVRQTVDEVPLQQVMEGMPVEEGFDEIKKRVNQGVGDGGNVDASAIRKLVRFSSIADAGGFHEIADEIDRIVIG